MPTRRHHLKVLAAALAAPALPRLARAQAWPSKQIRAVIPFTAGSTIDIVARIVFEPLSQQLGQSIIVENRGGAGGTIGAGVVARADPDGYTMLAHSSAHVATPAIYPNAPYDTARDFIAVAALGSSPNIVVVAPDKGFKTLQELVAAAKQKAGAMTFGTAGVGSSTHFTTERFRFSAGFDGVHVPFRGMPEVLTEVMTGRVDFCFSTIAAALPFIRDGKLLALAVSTPKRSSDAARRADHARARLCQFRLHVLERAVPPGQDPARDRREAHRRDPEGRDLAGRGRQARRSRASIRCRSRRRRSTRRSGRRSTRASRW